MNIYRMFPHAAIVPHFQYRILLFLIIWEELITKNMTTPLKIELFYFFVGRFQVYVHLQLLTLSNLSG